MKLHALLMLGLAAASFGGCIPPEGYCFEGRRGGHCQAEPDAGPVVMPDAGPPTLGTCERGDTHACGTFVTGTGTELTLGRYGAVMDRNVGEGFENTVDPNENVFCPIFVAAFAPDPAEGEEWLDLGDLDTSLFTVYRPANWVAGETYPIVSWGNGTCMQPETYGALLRYVASQGFVVVAANSRMVGAGTEQRRAIDFALAANADPSSPYYGRLDTSKIAAVGHSQGALGSTNAAADERVDSLILFNGSAPSELAKPYLAVSGDQDIGFANPEALAAVVNLAPQAAYLWFHMIPTEGTADGHLTLVRQPERVTEPTVAWLKYTLSDDQGSRSWFVGSDCRLCDRAAEFEYGQHGLD